MWYMANRWNWTYMGHIIVLHVRYMQSYKEHIRNIICVLYVTYIIIYIELILVLYLAYRSNVYLPYYMRYKYVAYMLGRYNSLGLVQYKTSKMVMPCVGLALD